MSEELLPWSWLRLALALMVQAAVFLEVLAALGPGRTGAPTWAALQLVLAGGLVALRMAPCAATQWSARRWLAIAFYATFFAAFFAGANFALDALHGAQRQRADIASHLGGLELWQLLCPGLFSFAAGALAGSLADNPPPLRRPNQASHKESNR